MAFIGAGTNITQRLVFNQGTIDFGSNRLVAVESVIISVAWEIADIYVIGSIKRADIARMKEKVTVSGIIKSFAPEMEMVAMGSSTAGTPSEIDAMDGQPTLLNPVITLYDRNNKEIQYQLLNAMFKSNKLTAKSEDWAQWDFEIEAIDIKELYTA
jgi:hypothetical protein